MCTLLLFVLWVVFIVTVQAIITITKYGENDKCSITRLRYAELIQVDLFC